MLWNMAADDDVCISNRVLKVIVLKKVSTVEEITASLIEY